MSDRNTLLQTVEQDEKSAALIATLPAVTPSGDTDKQDPSYLESPSPPPPPPPCEVFQKLEEIFSFLHRTLSGVFVVESSCETTSKNVTDEGSVSLNFVINYDCKLL